MHTFALTIMRDFRDENVARYEERSTHWSISLASVNATYEDEYITPI